MYKYKIEMRIATGNNGSKFPNLEFEYPKKYLPGGDTKLKEEIIIAAAQHLGEDPNAIDWKHSNTTIDFRGEVKENKQSDSNNSEKPKRSFWTPVWAIPFKIIWFLIRRILFFWI
jgi:hypothetical protein